MKNIILNERSESQRPHIVWDEVSRTIKLVETESRMVVASGSQGWGVVFNEFRVSVGEKSRDVMGNDGCKTM